MKIHKIYSHLNGEEFLIARKPALWREIKNVIANVDLSICKTKISKEKTMKGKIVYSPVDLNNEFKHAFANCTPPWVKENFYYYVCEDEKINRKIQGKAKEEQKEIITAAGFAPLITNNETDFVKDRVAVEVQFGKYAFVAHDLYVKHMAFFTADKIDLGIEILPMKNLEREMSSGPTFFEKDLNNIVRQGRAVPAVPLVLIGVGL